MSTTKTLFPRPGGKTLQLPLIEATPFTCCVEVCMQRSALTTRSARSRIPIDGSYVFVLAGFQVCVPNRVLSF